MLFVFIPFRNESPNIKYLFYNINFFTQQPEVSKIVLCDDGSTDFTFELIENFIKNLVFQKKIKISLLKNPQNIGKTKTINNLIYKFCKSPKDIIITWDASAFKINRSIFLNFLTTIEKYDFDINIIVTSENNFFFKLCCDLFKIHFSNGSCQQHKSTLLLTFSGQRIFKRKIWDQIPKDLKKGNSYDMEMVLNSLIKYNNLKYRILFTQISPRGERKKSKKFGRILNQYIPLSGLWFRIILFYAPMKIKIINWIILLFSIYLFFQISNFFIKCITLIFGLYLLIIYN